jgi:hypothetical protein
MKQFATRKEQIEKDFLRVLLRDLEKAGCLVNARGRALISQELKSAAIVSACEERSRTLDILAAATNPVAAQEVLNAIIKQGIPEILGYENE